MAYTARPCFKTNKKSMKRKADSFWAELGFGQVLVAHVYKPSFSGGRDQEDRS
jgi:hypothetical protein